MKNMNVSILILLLSFTAQSKNLVRSSILWEIMKRKPPAIFFKVSHTELDLMVMANQI
jgi:hypothetical protein